MPRVPPRASGSAVRGQMYERYDSWLKQGHAATGPNGITPLYIAMVYRSQAKWSLLRPATAVPISLVADNLQYNLIVNRDRSGPLVTGSGAILYIYSANLHSTTPKAL